MNKIGIIGAGTWGVALARMLSISGHSVDVWAYDLSELTKLPDLTYMHKNLPNIYIPKEVTFTDQLEQVCRGKDYILVVVPSVYVRETMEKASRYISNAQIIVSFSKGFEFETCKTMSEVLEDALPSGTRIVAMSGPSHAEELAKGLPTTIVAASEDIEAAQQVQQCFSNDILRVYTNTDIKGVELCGALKNIIALAAGISAGLGYGDNAKAAIITRGLSEIARLGEKMGCLSSTFSGLAGMGDMIATATSVHSRNNRCGYLIGQGLPANQAVKRVNMVVEGIYALPSAMRLSEQYQAELPIIQAVYRIVYGSETALSLAKQLMNREYKTELNQSVLNLKYEKELLQKYFNLEKGGQSMKRVITYGTFDLLHYGHINLLKRAKALGDYLIVVISSDEFNWNEKHKKCYFTYEQRKALVEAVRYVDLVIPEESWNQKRSDMHEYHIDTFVMGDDWKGKFDFLKEEGVEVVYLPRTPEISSSQIKKDLNASGEVADSETDHTNLNTNPES